MNYCQFQPPASLRKHVLYFWTMESSTANPAPQSFGPLVDGCPGLLFQQASEGRFYDQDGKSIPEIIIYGQTIRRTAIYMLGRYKTVGVCFQPYSLPSLFGFDAHALTDGCVDMQLLAPDLVNQLIHTASAAHQIDVLSSYLTRQIQHWNKSVDKLTLYALTQLIESGGSASLKELHQSLRITERSLERKFKQHVGISPKLFARVCRFQASLTQLNQRNLTKLSDIAFENGYADQSHFIRSFREFTGYSPSHYQKRPHDAPNRLHLLLS